MNAEDKAALKSWEEHFKSMLKALPVDLSETHEQKRDRIKSLEDNPEGWKNIISQITSNTRLPLFISNLPNVF